MVHVALSRVGLPCSRAAAFAGGRVVDMVVEWGSARGGIEQVDDREAAAPRESEADAVQPVMHACWHTSNNSNI